MSDLLLLPDAEAVVSAFLRSRESVEELVGDHVWTELPAKRKEVAEWRFPGVRVTRIGGVPVMSRPLVADRPLLQFDIWGGPKSLTRRIAETCRAELALIGEADLGDGVNARTPDIGALAYLPDDDFTPAKPRYTFDVSILLRATEPTGS
jgi:hypothetical protein